uniref:Methylmalonic aciduria and homocystinuria type D protein n=1 Tax=Chlamydomonas leiostraca TaxID=1034604 RepID=A0A7S0RSJ5_9CHLO|mmetsp:Transcript_3049/g.7626  ORF Transcript_3049/g.7626 Transcript_3049/m.7626 type:complete len:168 (+) Transcript_3049:115-618(+)
MSTIAEGVTAGGIEYSIHSCPARIRREVASVFPSVDLDKLLIVPTCQHAAMDLVQTGETVDVEKDNLLEKFMAWASAVCSKLGAQGHWADYIDPCSGLPMVHTDGPHQVYPEVEGLAVLKGFKTSNAGCCKVLLHPRWGSAVYPASMFTTAPADALQAAIDAANSSA